MTGADPQPPRDPRTQSVWDLHDFARGRGVEIGPLFRPLVRRHEADVRYLDVFDQDELKAQYADDPGVPVDQIVKVDFALSSGGAVGSMAETAGSDAPYDWFVASHVVEHVPDLIGWLSELADMTADGGSLVLVVPDMRYSFDLFRPATTVGMMIQAHRDGDVRPSTRAVFDFYRDAITVESEALWQGWVQPSYADRKYPLSLAAEQAVTSVSEYIDTHVWLFTPELFLEQMRELRMLGLSDWYVDRLEPTSLNQLEFMVRMRRMTREVGGTEARPDDEVRPTATRPEWGVPTVPTDDDLERRAEIARLRRKLRRQRKTIVDQRRRLDRLSARLDGTLSSRRWKVAGIVASPLDLARRMTSR